MSLDMRYKRNREAYKQACLANYQKRIEVFGEEARVCWGCIEILQCDGPVSFELCRILQEMAEQGLIIKKGPTAKWPYWEKKEIKDKST
jgi:hypothetical protein